jgi:excisionase family DNA binding protein
VPDRLLSPIEVAAALGVSRSTVLRRIQSGELAAVRVGSGRTSPLRIDPRDVADIVNPVGLIPLSAIAARCGRSVEWALAWSRFLPVVERPDGLYVQPSELRAWLRASEQPVEERV